MRIAHRDSAGALADPKRPRTMPRSSKGTAKVTLAAADYTRINYKNGRSGRGTAIARGDCP